MIASMSEANFIDLTLTMSFTTMLNTFSWLPPAAVPTTTNSKEKRSTDCPVTSPTETPDWMPLVDKTSLPYEATTIAGTYSKLVVVDI